MKKTDICFYPTDDVELNFISATVEGLRQKNFEPTIDLTMSRKSDVGVFLAHSSKNKPNLAGTSVVMLHDLGQAHNRWPFFWRQEPWGKYDYGILPNKFWGDMYRDQYCAEILMTLRSQISETQDLSSLKSYTQLNVQFHSPFFPKNGVEVIGWPKYNLNSFLQNREAYLTQNGNLQQRKTLNVLYAPSWEYNHQQDKFINSIVDLAVHIYVKQQYWLGDGGVHMERVNQMENLHKNRWKNVTILDPKTDIFDALVYADCIVSDESSTLTEGLMVGVLPFAVTDWLVPDVSPPRKASVPYPYVTKIEQSEIRGTIQNLMLPGALDDAIKSIKLDPVDSKFADNPVEAVVNHIVKIFRTSRELKR